MTSSVSWPTPRLPISRIVSPQSVAIIGASESTDKFGGRILHYLIKHGYEGRILPINPRGGMLRGLAAYPAIGDAPGPIDLAILAVPANALLQQIDDCAKAGVGACIVITAQLAEFDAAGAELERQITEVARSQGMRLIGPNCLGVINPVHKAALTSSLSMELDRLRAGPIAIVSQSGALMATMLNLATDYGAGFSRCVSLGNQADIEFCDVFEYLIEDEATRIICAYVEGLKSPQRFIELARKARAAGKPVLAVKTGRSEAGVIAAKSHTASLAGAFATFEAAARAAGVILLDDPEGMALAADALARLGPATGDGIGLASGSGGGAGIMADRVSERGLRLAHYSPDTIDRLAEWFPPSRLHNPTDLGGGKIFTLEGMGQAVETILAEPDVGLMIQVLTTQPMMTKAALMMADVQRRSGKPMLYVITAASTGNDARAGLLEAGFPYYDRLDDALRVADALVQDWHARQALTHTSPPRLAAPPTLPALKPGQLTEPQAKALFAQWGVPVTRDETVTDADAAIRAAERIGYPVVLKGVNDTIVHKSDLGLVHLNLRDADAVRAAFNEVQAILARHGGGSAVVQEMARGEVELIVGARWDEEFGPMVLTGFGGVLVEVLKDVQLAPAPVTPAVAEAMLRRLKMWPVLEGVRGRPAADVAAVVDAIVRISWLAHDLGPKLAELDINPLIVRAAGKGAVAADGRATIGGAA